MTHQIHSPIGLVKIGQSSGVEEKKMSWFKILYVEDLIEFLNILLTLIPS